MAASERLLARKLLLHINSRCLSLIWLLGALLIIDSDQVLPQHTLVSCHVTGYRVRLHLVLLESLLSGLVVYILGRLRLARCARRLLRL